MFPEEFKKKLRHHERGLFCTAKMVKFPDVLFLSVGNLKERDTFLS